MSPRLWIGVVALLTTLPWMAPATANAQARQRYPDVIGQPGGAAYDNGYREGRRNGERDARAGRRYDVGRDGAYRRGDSGYGYGNRDAYRSAFQRGYAEGYRVGYARYARNTGPYGRDGVWGSDPRYGGYPGGYGGYSHDYAFDRGYADGYKEGLDAAHDRDRYDPYREKSYRKGDSGYDRRYGSKDYYKQSYRDGFKSGYDRGYNEGRYGRGWPR